MRFLLVAESVEEIAIDDLHISHNAWGMDANKWVLLIRYYSSYNSLVVNVLELPYLAVTLCLYETRVTRVIRSCAVDV